MTIIQIIEELITILSGSDIASDVQAAIPLVTQILSLLGDKNAARDIQSQSAYQSALLGSVSAAQYLYHNSNPDSGMPHEDIIDGQFYWAKLSAAGWTVTPGGLTGTVIAPK